MYNAGTNRVRKNQTPQMTLNYVSTIMNYKNGLNELFSVQIVAKTTEPTSHIAMNFNK